jgi:transcriptional regulator with XRE-family HTH domain
MKNKTFDDLILDPNTENDLIFSDLVINSDFIQEIKILMKKNNIKNRKELAAKLGVSTAYISMVFSGRKLINIRFLSLLQNVFNVSFRLITSDEIEKLKQSSRQAIQIMAASGYYNLFCNNDEIIAPKAKEVLTDSQSMSHFTYASDSCILH